MDEFSHYRQILKVLACPAAGFPTNPPSKLKLAMATMAANLLLDHRISRDRLSSFGAAQAFTGIDQIRDTLLEYKHTQVCPSRTSGLQPAYLRPDNQSNNVTNGQEKQLMTVLNLSYLGRAYSAADQVFRIPGFPRFEVNPASTTAVTGWLTKNMPALPDRPAFMELLLEARNRYQENEDKYLRFTWAAESVSFKPYLSPDNPSRWLQGVGVSADEPVWVAVLKYSSIQSRASMPLFRPTQLDSGWYPYHFPSPPQTPIVRGGHTVFLQRGNDLARHPGLVDEYIHISIPFSIGHWQQAGSLVDLVTATVGDELALNRKAHAAILINTYGSEVADWLDICR